MPDAVSWTLIIICLVFSFFFSASETALACCNKYKMQVMADEGKKSAKLLIKVLDKYDRALTTVLVGNNIVAVAISAISALLFYKYLKGTGLEESSSIISSIIMAFVVYVLGDTLPKTIAKAIPDTISLAFIYPIYFFMIIFFPINILFDGLMKLIDKIFKVKPEEEITEEDIEEAITKATEDENLDEQSKEIAQSALDFIDTNVKEVLTPKEKMFAVDIKDLTPDKITDIICETNYSRIPVYDGTIDNIIGVLYVKHYYQAFANTKNPNIKNILLKPYFVSSKVMIDDLFTGFKKRHTHVAFVRDDKNNLIGMVTMEDVLEELVSDIAEPSLAKRRNK